MKRKLLIFLAAGSLFAVLLLAGCAGNNQNNTNNQTNGNQTNQTQNGNQSNGAQAATIRISAMDNTFNQSTVTVPAGSQVTVYFDNQDSGIGHTFSVYTSSGADSPIHIGQFTTGPEQVTETFMAPTTPGTYYFQCDVHPTTMNGDFIVT